MGVQRADAETRRAATRGTAVHDMVEKFLKNVPAPTEGHSHEHIPCFNQLRTHLRKVDNIVTQESALWSDTLRCAGRVDCIGEYCGRLAVIDFKTSTAYKQESMVEDYFLQTTAYALMMQERCGLQIDELVILMSVEKGAVPMVFCRPVEPYIEPLLRRINNWHATYGAK